MKDEKLIIGEALERFIACDAGNAMPAHHNMKIFDPPLIGYAAADDAYFKAFKKDGVIGPCFMTPREWLPGAQTVISYFLPFTREIRDSNRPAGLPSGEWVSARIDGEAFNNSVRVFLVGLLENLGAQALAPVADPRFFIREIISNWSERHIAFTAGLGTFGLHRGLITARGTAGRLGSVVTALRLAPTPRPYTRYHEYCLFYTNGTCGACIRRCPPGVISVEGKNNKACSDYIDGSILPLYAPRYGCGKCNVGVPCEFKKPEGLNAHI